MIDNNEFNDLGGVWDDGSSPWNTEDLNDLHRLLDDEGERPFPDEQAVESRSARREVQEPQARSHRAAKAAKAPREPSKKAKASKAKPDKEKPPKKEKSRKKQAPAEPEDPFAGLPAMKGGKEKQFQPDGDQDRKAGKKAKKEKPPKPPKDPEKARRAKLTFTVFAVILSLIFIGATVGGYMVTANPNSFPNVYIGGYFAGNMSREQIDAVLVENNWDEQVDTSLQVKLPA